MSTEPDSMEDLHLALDALTARLNELEAENKRLRAARDCENLMAGYSYLGSAHRLRDYMKLWADRPDSRLEMPWGIYDGYEGVCRCYLEDHTDRGDPGAEQELKGTMFIHPMTTCRIIVAEDLQTARGAWVSPGVEAVAGTAMWCMSKYAVDFISTPDGWRIWHMKLYPVFLTPYEVPFTEKDKTDGIGAVHPDHAPSCPRYDYDLEAMYPFNEPILPLAYTHFDELEPIIGD
ncbi:MAG: nuclear transport factor 2 family protein [Oscillospiraceae bacterium]|nr:nuclear transport factor 2 family protein [Oscillospiraceae bacterium]